MSGMSAHGVGGYGGVSEIWMVVLDIGGLCIIEDRKIPGPVNSESYFWT